MIRGAPRLDIFVAVQCSTVSIGVRFQNLANIYVVRLIKYSGLKSVGLPAGAGICGAGPAPGRRAATLLN